MSTLPALAGRTELAGGDRARLRARIRRAAPQGPTGSGDWIVGALAAAASEDLRLSPEDLAIYQGLLRAVSPVVRLTHPDEGGDADALAASLAPLAARVDARVMECAEDRVAAAWSARGSALLGAAFVRDLTAARWTALGAAMRAWCAACDDARRMDLARAAAKAVSALIPRLLAPGPQALRARLSRAPGLRSVAERDALLGAVRSVVDVGAWLLRRRDVLAGERYGDDRYEEAQVFLRDVDGALGASRRGVLELSRALSDQIG
jgi:hypothetical protein